MQLRTYDEILILICDAFDTLISPKSITRSNTNIIYLMFKAVAKGFEVINNVCVTLSNKFNPETCSEEDLDSVATIVGTERYEGSESGLQIIITNTGEAKATLIAGTYYFKFDDDLTFYFDILENTDIEAGTYLAVLAMSEKIGAYPVTAQTDISITSDREIPSDLSFSCTDNETLLGVSAETDLEFRKRILTGTNNQDTMAELEAKLKNLPYLFDCRCVYNQTPSSMTLDTYTLPPYTLAIFYSGMLRNEIAKVIASKIICPTLSSEDSKAVRFYSDVFANGYYEINLIPFKEILFDVKVIYRVDAQYVDSDSAEAQIHKALNGALTGNVHRPVIKEDDAYNVVENLNIAGIEVLGVDLIYNGESVNFIDVPASRIPKLDHVSFLRG